MRGTGEQTMSVLIKGMDMPNGCRHCKLLINCDDCEGYKCFCSAMGSDIGYFEKLSKTKRHDDCPLVEVKETTVMDFKRAEQVSHSESWRKIYVSVN